MDDASAATTATVVEGQETRRSARQPGGSLALRSHQCSYDGAARLRGTSCRFTAGELGFACEQGVERAFDGTLAARLASIRPLQATLAVELAFHPLLDARPTVELGVIRRSVGMLNAGFGSSAVMETVSRVGIARKRGMARQCRARTVRNRRTGDPFEGEMPHGRPRRTRGCSDQATTGVRGLGSGAGIGVCSALRRRRGRNRRRIWSASRGWPPSRASDSRQRIAWRLHSS